MGSFEVFVATSDGQTRIPILETDQPDKASELVKEIVAVAGTTSFMVGVLITAGTPPVPLPGAEGTTRSQPPEGHDPTPSSKPHQARPR